MFRELYYQLLVRIYERFKNHLLSKSSYIAVFYDDESGFTKVKHYFNSGEFDPDATPRFADKYHKSGYAVLEDALKAASWEWNGVDAGGKRYCWVKK